ncbi:MAG: hypothetical protein AAGA90_00250 [Actinomycetota bacterium]
MADPSDQHRAEDSGQEHLVLLDCCREGDRAGARDVLDRHLTTAADALVDQLELLTVPE